MLATETAEVPVPGRDGIVRLEIPSASLISLWSAQFDDTVATDFAAWRATAELGLAAFPLQALDLSRLWASFVERRGAPGVLSTTTVQRALFGPLDRLAPSKARLYASFALVSSRNDIFAPRTVGQMVAAAAHDKKSTTQAAPGKGKNSASSRSLPPPPPGLLVEPFDSAVMVAAPKDHQRELDPVAGWTAGYTPVPQQTVRAQRNAKVASLVARRAAGPLPVETGGDSPWVTGREFKILEALDRMTRVLDDSVGGELSDGLVFVVFFFFFLDLKFFFFFLI
jgi:hypothetical protein